MTLSRREFLRAGAGAGGALLVGFWLPGCSLLPAPSRIERHAARTGEFAPNAWVRVSPDDRVTFILDRVEMGQGTMTSHAALLAEELAIAPGDLEIEMAEADRKYDNPDPDLRFQVTGGSTSTRTSWEPLRRAGAAAREMLRRAASERWNVPLAECSAAGGAIAHAASDRSARYGELAGAAAQQDVPSGVDLKPPDEFRYIGRSLPRLDAPAKSNGTAIYGIDVAVDGARVAVIARPPVLGSRARAVNDAAARAMPGVEAVVSLGTGVAAIAGGYWEARRAADALEIDWELPPAPLPDSAALREAFTARTRDPGKAVRDEGDARAALARETSLESVYEVPYLAHAPLEPMNCTARVAEDRCEIWAPTQSPGVASRMAAELTGLPEGQVDVHTTFLGGGFGRRLSQDYVVEAVRIAMEVPYPIKLIWSREDDVRGGTYRPMAVHRLLGKVGAGGEPVSWLHRVVGQSVIAHSVPDFLGARVPAALPRPLRRLAQRQARRAFQRETIADFTSTEGASDLPYAIPDLRVELSTIETGVPIGWWRSVGHSHTAFAVECFFDELAHAGGRDPLALRLELLRDAPRLRRTLELASQKSGWGRDLPAGSGIGLASHESFGSYCSQVMEVRVEDGAVRVERVVAAIDCGRVINPDIVRAQIESGIIFGLSAALYQQITLENGRVRESNFHDFPLLRMHECPAIEVHIVPSDEEPTGVGEPGVPPVAPALGNAIFAAIGARIRRLPVAPELARIAAAREDG